VLTLSYAGLRVQGAGKCVGKSIKNVSTSVPAFGAHLFSFHVLFFGQILLGRCSSDEFKDHGGFAWDAAKARDQRKKTPGDRGRENWGGQRAGGQKRTRYDRSLPHCPEIVT